MIAPGSLAAALAAVLLCSPGWSQQRHVYVGEVSARAVTIAWGTTGGNGNTIGRSSKRIPGVRLRFDGKEIATGTNWARVEKLTPDRAYDYAVDFGEGDIRRGTVRTWPEKADRLVFFAIGDFGNGRSGQEEIARVMSQTAKAQADKGDWVRFVITLGDNLYGNGTGPALANSGNDDEDWEKRFFIPYRDILRSIPFYASLGNHDGNQSDKRGDLTAYLDNFFFPGGVPARYYRFVYANLAEFFALDSTKNSAEGPPRPAYLAGGDQWKWMEAQIPDQPNRRFPWKFAYFHHPPFSAGPEHAPSINDLAHWVRLFNQQRVAAVFAGHEHNFQMTKRTQETGDVAYFVSGAGGQLRDGKILKRIRRARESAGSPAVAAIDGWEAERHFLLIEVTRTHLRVTPVGAATGAQPKPLRVHRPDGGTVTVPIEVTVRATP